MPQYAIDFPESFPRREEAPKRTKIKYTVAKDPDGTLLLDLQRELASYSTHEQDVIAYARNPHDAFKLFVGLDTPVTQEIVKALAETYLQQNGDWSK